MIVGINLLVCLLFIIPSQCFSATINSLSCSLADVNMAIASSNTGDLVIIPDGNCTWGDSASFIDVNASIILQGSGSTVITLSDTAGSWTSGTIRISDNATVKDLKIYGSTGSTNATAFSVGNKDGWRITGITFIGTENDGGYFVYVGHTYGLIDNCSISGGDGSNEWIFVRGPSDSWQTVNSIGSAGNVFIENNTFYGPGYVTDCNSNSRCVVRYNTITGNQKIDGHGKCTNTPNRGVRNMEVYNNRWTLASGNTIAMELRGGTYRVFNNVIDTSGIPYMKITDYAVHTYNCYGYSGTYCCPADYPCDDQIGVGIDPKSAASEPAYFWGNTKSGGAAWSPIAGPRWDGDLGYDLTAAQAEEHCGPTYTAQTQIQADRDYFVSAIKPAAMSAYTPYTCPHPLTGLTGSCDSAVAGTSGYNVALTSHFGGSGSFNMR